MQMTPTIRYHTVLIVALCLAILAAFSTPGEPDGMVAGGPVVLSGTMPDLWTTIDASGRVEPQPAGCDAARLPLHRPDHVGPQSCLQTENRGRVTRASGVDVILADPDSK